MIAARRYVDFAARFEQIRHKASQRHPRERPLRADYSSHGSRTNHRGTAPAIRTAAAVSVWIYEPPDFDVTGYWTLSGGSSSTVIHFKLAAVMAAAALRCDGAAEAWLGWLELLRRESADYEAKWTETAHDMISAVLIDHDPNPIVEQVRVEEGALGDVLEASARYLRRLADEAETWTFMEGVETPIDVTRVPETEAKNQEAHRLVSSVLKLSFEAEDQQSGEPSRATARHAFLDPKLVTLNMSVLDWAKAANVDYNTIQDYLDGRTLRLRINTRTKLAKAINIPPTDLPQ
jgi:hypothetical protein